MTVIDRLTTLFTADTSGLEAGAKRAEKAVRGYSDILGKGGPLGQFGTLLKGGGAVAGFALFSKEVSSIAQKLREARDSGQSWASSLEHSLPVIRNVRNGLDDLAEAIDGIKAAQAKEEKKIGTQRGLNQFVREMDTAFKKATIHDELNKSAFEAGERYLKTLEKISEKEREARSIQNEGLFRQIHALRERAKAVLALELMEPRRIEREKELAESMERAQKANERWLRQQEDDWQQVLDGRVSELSKEITSKSRPGPVFAGAIASGSQEAFQAIVDAAQLKVEEEQKRLLMEANKQREKMLRIAEEEAQMNRDRRIWELDG